MLITGAGGKTQLPVCPLFLNIFKDCCHIMRKTKTMQPENIEGKRGGADS